VAAVSQYAMMARKVITVWRRGARGLREIARDRARENAREIV
jgi:hypothetical protein